MTHIFWSKCEQKRSHSIWHFRFNLGDFEMWKYICVNVAKVSTWWFSPKKLLMFLPAHMTRTTTMIMSSPDLSWSAWPTSSMVTSSVWIQITTVHSHVFKAKNMHSSAVIKAQALWQHANHRIIIKIIKTFFKHLINYLINLKRI